MITWLRYKYQASQVRVLHIMDFPSITEAKKMALTTTDETLMGLPPLHMKVEAEAQAGIYRLSCNEEWKVIQIIMAWACEQSSGHGEGTHPTDND